MWRGCAPGHVVAGDGLAKLVHVLLVVQCGHGRVGTHGWGIHG